MERSTSKRRWRARAAGAIAALAVACGIAHADTRSMVFKNETQLDVDDLHIVFKNTTDVASDFPSDRESADGKTHNLYGLDVPAGGTVKVTGTTSRGVPVEIEEWWWTLGGDHLADGRQIGDKNPDSKALNVKLKLSTAGGTPATGDGVVRVRVGGDEVHEFRTTAGATPEATIEQLVEFLTLPHLLDVCYLIDYSLEGGITFRGNRLGDPEAEMAIDIIQQDSTQPIISCSNPLDQSLLDGFDYGEATPIGGTFLWEPWYTGGQDAFVTSERAASPPYSLRLSPLSDIVHRFAIDDGKWRLGVQTYVPSLDGCGDAYIVMMNQYAEGVDNWSLQVRLGGCDGLVESQFDGGTLPLIRDAWTLLEADIDLDADTLDIRYAGQKLAAGLRWSEAVSGGGVTSIANIDLFSAGATVYIDDVSLTRGCDDCDGDGICDQDEDDCNENGVPDRCDSKHCPADLGAPFGVLNVFDFLAFQSLFGDGGSCADMAAPFGVLNVFDFLAFQTAFSDGC